VEPSSLPFQPGLFATGSAPRFDATFSRLERLWLDEAAWIDVAPGFVESSDALFEQVLRSRDWDQRTRRMYDGRVREPRLTAPWSLASGEPLEPPLLEEIRRALGARYGVTFDSAGFNLYRDGQDGVAWHGDRIS
jgi:alkylated DNA repair dioxygenase AlkB